MISYRILGTLSPHSIVVDNKCAYSCDYSNLALSASTSVSGPQCRLSTDYCDADMDDTIPLIVIVIMYLEMRCRASTFKGAHHTTPVFSVSQGAPNTCRG